MLNELKWSSIDLETNALNNHLIGLCCKWLADRITAPSGAIKTISIVISRFVTDSIISLGITTKYGRLSKMVRSF